MKLAIAEGVLRVDPCLGGDRVAVLDDPLVTAVPFRKVLAVEKHGGIGRRLVVLARRDNFGLLPDDAGLVLGLGIGPVTMQEQRRGAGGSEEGTEEQSAKRLHGVCL